MCVCQMDQKQVDAFGEKMMGIVNNGALALMISLGHRTGLFDAIAAIGAPATSEKIARQAGLNERYVREWLGAMATGGIVTVEPAAEGEANRFSLPPEHAALLVRGRASYTMGTLMQFFPLLGTVEEELLHCFRHGGGVPYESFGRFHEIMAEDSGQGVVAGLEDAILPLIPGLLARLEAGIEVLDLGCGSGLAISKMARLFPRSRFTGIDFSNEAITRARAFAAEEGITNVRFEQADAATFDAAEAFDFITTFDAVHDQAHPDRVLRNIARALRPNGDYLMVDISASSNVAENLDHPIGPFLYTISTMHCMTVSLANEGMGLGAVWGRQTAERMLREAGFAQIEISNVEGDFQNDYYVVRK